MQTKHIARTAGTVTGVVLAAMAAFAWIVKDPDKFQRDVVGRVGMG